MTFHINIQQGLTYSILLLHKWFYINTAVSVCGVVLLNLSYNNCCGFRGTPNWQSRSMRDEDWNRLLGEIDCLSINLTKHKKMLSMWGHFHVVHFTWEQPVKQCNTFTFWNCIACWFSKSITCCGKLWQHIMHGNSCIGLCVLAWD